MTVIYIEHSVSPALQKEIAALQFYRLDPNDPTKKDIFEWMTLFPKTLCGMELISQMKRYSGKQKILDIGCGPGFSSIYLAMQGHDVSALDPSPLDCSILSENAKKMKLSVNTYQCTGEAIDNIPENNFDLCIFNSSLHHCEDPVRALCNCFQKLRDGGRIIVLNEPILKFYQSKKSFYSALIKTPEKMGHYGGNEHIYYYHEYKNMLKSSGFVNISGYLNAKFYNPRLFIENIISKKINGIYLDGDFKLLLKFNVLFFINKFIKCGRVSFFILWILKKMSLVQVSFEATKPKN